MSEIRVKSTGTIKLYESDNTSHVTIASPASLSANRTITIPDADVTLGAGTTINNNADNRVITGSGTANTLEGEANLTYNGTIFGVGASADLGTGVHIKTADSGGGVESNADELIVEGSGNTGISILSGTSNVGAVHFNDSGGNERGAFKYNHSADDLQIKTSGAEQVRIFGNGVMACADGVALGVGIASTASNLLDDYEFGDFTPSWTAVGSGSISATPTNFAKYVKSGRQVTVSVSTIFQTSGTFTDYKLTNLPFTQSMIGAGAGVEYGQVGCGLMLQGVNNSTNFLVKKYDGGFIANAYVMLSYTYIATA